MTQIRVRTAQGKPGKRDFLKKSQGEPGKLREFSDHFYNLRENSWNFILPNVSDQIGGAIRISEASKWINGTHSPSTIISLFVKLLYVAPWSGLFCCAKPFFMMFLIHFFSSYSREKFLKILDIFCRQKTQTMPNRYPLLSGREYLELSLPMHANLGLILVILILNIWLFILIIWSFLLIIWLQDKIKQISSSSGNVISTLGNHFCDYKQSFGHYQ